MNGVQAREREVFEPECRKSEALGEREKEAFEREREGEELKRERERC